MSVPSSLHGAKVRVLFHPDGKGGVSGIVSPTEAEIVSAGPTGVVQMITIDAGEVDKENLEAMMRSIKQSKSLLGERYKEADMRALEPAALRREFLSTFERLLVMKNKREKLAGH